MTKPQVCSDFATCTNKIGSYSCTCNEDFTGDGKNCSGNRKIMYHKYMYITTNGTVSAS